MIRLNRNYLITDMSIQVKVVSAVLTHDTELFSDMVFDSLIRILTVSSHWAHKKIEPKPKIKQAKNQFGTKPLISVDRIIFLK